MARSSWRQRSDGVYLIIGQGRRFRRAAVAFATLLTALAMAVAVTTAAVVYLVIGLPLLVAAAGFLLVRRASRPATPPATVLTLARRNRPLSVAARDAGA
ncbi:hypothetical protein [Anaeromyxobacter diazotrophicus]|uniref:Uncharacterized protein n=1 Tax=Anaeromyxobacter diazotrophicus TaxID=2590199 RepID=A0A7I9VQH0_9BACT|nr:hypothetical protein [Anaeromyxobacter diazotrophicus]GEJ58498.1 hypothetical protein AMYX_32390 [Anaeromyxobacter diazotrophicus]